MLLQDPFRRGRLVARPRFRYGQSWPSARCKRRVRAGAADRLVSGHALGNVPAARTTRRAGRGAPPRGDRKSTSELQSLMRISYAVFCLKKKNILITREHQNITYT